MAPRYCPTCEDELDPLPSNSADEDPEMFECPTCGDVYHADEVPEAEPDDDPYEIMDDEFWED